MALALALGAGALAATGRAPASAQLAPVPTPEPVATPEPPAAPVPEYLTTLTARFTVDPVAKVLTAAPGSAQVDALGPSGEVLTTTAVPLALTTDPVPPPAGSGSGSCAVEGDGASLIHPYEEQRAFVPSGEGMGFYLQYWYRTFQLDNAALRGSDNHTVRQYVQCVAGGGTPRDGGQRRNGGGTTMEDSTPRMLPCSPTLRQGCDWGTGLDASSPAKTIATVNLGVEGKIGDSGKSATVKGGVTIPITTDGGQWTGGQGPLPSSAVDHDPLPSQFQGNEVNGWWQSGTKSSRYQGNASSGLWEYPMSDSAPRTIQGSAWMQWDCGFLSRFFGSDAGCDKTGYAPVPSQPVPSDPMAATPVGSGPLDTGYASPEGEVGVNGQYGNSGAHVWQTISVDGPLEPLPIRVSYRGGTLADGARYRITIASRDSANCAAGRIVGDATSTGGAFSKEVPGPSAPGFYDICVVSWDHSRGAFITFMGDLPPSGA